jgi:hypothetical protein
MRTSSAIIAEIKTDASDLQRKILTLPGDGGCDAVQSKVLDQVQDGLAGWRRTLAELEKAFSKETNAAGKVNQS